MKDLKMFKHLVTNWGGGEGGGGGIMNYFKGEFSIGQQASSSD